MCNRLLKRWRRQDISYRNRLHSNIIGDGKCPEWRFLFLNPGYKYYQGNHPQRNDHCSPQVALIMTPYIISTISLITVFKKNVKQIALQYVLRFHKKNCCEGI